MGITVYIHIYMKYIYIYMQDHRFVNFTIQETRTFFGLKNKKKNEIRKKKRKNDEKKRKE